MVDSSRVLGRMTLAAARMTLRNGVIRVGVVQVASEGWASPQMMFPRFVQLSYWDLKANA